MTKKLLKQMMQEENEILTINDPDREVEVTDSLVTHFGNRNGLFEKSRKRKAMERDNYEFQCVICFRKYSTEKHVSDHKKVTHFAFLNSHLLKVRKSTKYQPQPHQTQ